jgi:hypothetical protein
MLRRFVSFLFIAIALVSFVASPSYAQYENRHGRRPEKRVYVVKRKVHRIRRHEVIIRSHRKKVGIRVKVNL